MRVCFFFFQAEDGIRDLIVTGVQTCALPICTLSREGVGSLAAHAGRELGPTGARDRVALEALPLSRAAHDDDDPRLPRPPGYVPHLPATRPRLQPVPASRAHRVLDGGGAHGRRADRARLRSHRPPPRDRAGARVRGPHHTALGLRPVRAAPLRRGLRDAVHGAGRVGSDTGAHHGAVAGLGAGLPARLRLPVWRRDRRNDRRVRGVAGGAPPLRLGDGPDRRHGPPPRGGGYPPRPGGPGRRVRLTTAASGAAPPLPGGGGRPPLPPPPPLLPPGPP